HGAREDHMEAAVPGAGAVRVDRDDRVRLRLVADPGPLVHARPERPVGVPRQFHRGAPRFEERAHPVGDIEGGPGLGVTVVGGGAGGVARLAVRSDVHLAVDLVGVLEVARVVPRVDDDDLALEGAGRGGSGGRGGVRGGGGAGLRVPGTGTGTGTGTGGR